jgi:hypothetical protein
LSGLIVGSLGMATSAPQFFMEGQCQDEDAAYRDTRDLPRGIYARRYVEYLWDRFWHYALADKHSLRDARRHFHQRFWEMYLAVALIGHGLALRGHGEEGPDFYACVGKRKVWFEGIAPGPGDGDDQVPQMVYGKCTEVPVEKILLRLTHALITKRERYESAVAKGIVSPDDYYVLAVNSRGIRPAPDAVMPYCLQAFLGVGPLAAYLDVQGKVVDSGYQHRPTVWKANGAPVSTSAFLGRDAAFCSAVLHSGVDCANYPEQIGADFFVLHNPNARRPLDAAILQWCKQCLPRTRA